MMPLSCCGSLPRGWICRRGALLILLLVSGNTVFAQGQQPKFRVIALDEASSIHKPFVDAAKVWLEQEAIAGKFAIDYIHNTEKIDDTFLSRYELFIQLDYPPYAWTPTAASAFQKCIEEGKEGWIGFHHATLLGEFDGYPMWPWFSDFMGGIRFKSYIAKRVSGTVVVEDAAHPALRGLPSTFVIAEEEWYTYDKDPRPNVHVLAHVDESSYQPSSDIKMGDHPVVWTNERMKARNIYILMGHHPSLFENDAYKTLVHNAISWAARDQGRDKAGSETKG